MFSSIKDRDETWWVGAPDGEQMRPRWAPCLTCQRPVLLRNDFLVVLRLIDWSKVRQLLAMHSYLTDTRDFLSVFSSISWFSEFRSVFPSSSFPPWLQFPVCLSASDTLVRLSSFVTSGLSWFLRTEADRCSWLLLLSCALSGKATPSTPFIRQLRDGNVATVRSICVCVCVSLCNCVSFLGSGLRVRFHSDSRGSHGGGPNICSEGQEQKHWHVSLFTEMTFPPLSIPGSLLAAVLLSANLPQARLKPSARISPRPPKSPLTKCQNYIFLCSHPGL